VHDALAHGDEPQASLPVAAAWARPSRTLRILCSLLGAFWCLTGLFKLLEWCMTRAPWAWEDHPGLWTDRFPSWLILTVSAIELTLGVSLLLRPGRRVIVIALLLLAVFTAALLAWPPDGKPCGCFGALEPLIGYYFHPVARNALLGLLHAVAWVLVRPPRPKGKRP
jgi:hypothetical protein